MAGMQLAHTMKSIPVCLYLLLNTRLVTLDSLYWLVNISLFALSTSVFYTG